MSPPILCIIDATMSPPVSPPRPSLRPRVVLAALAGMAACAVAGGCAAPSRNGERSSLPETRAERTDYRETSRYDDVVAFLEAVDARSPRIHMTHFGYSHEGRPLLLAIAGPVPDASPETARAAEAVRVLILGNIHGGEVCGKEASQMLLRSLAAGQHAAWLDSLVLLVAPLYNADGNERVALTNRPRQHGPVGGMGQRANAQGLDLNRDHIKLETPEARSLVRLMRDYDPHLVIDLHTTNGTRHAYMLTYAGPLNPNTHPGLAGLLNDEWLPEVARSVKEKDGWDIFEYGNVPRPGSEMPRGWYTFDHRPRFNNNYVGLRNRLAILSEAYAYATFRERVGATLRFLEEILDFAAVHGDRIREAVETADSQPVVGENLAMRAAHAASPEPVEILLGDVVEERNPYSGERMLRRTGAVRPESMIAYTTFLATETGRVPGAYLVPADLHSVRALLEDHGIAFRRLAATTRVEIEVFDIATSTADAEPFQMHQQRTLTGSWRRAERVVPAGTLVVPAGQPLGRLLFYLLEPRSDDGLVNWNVLDPFLEGAPEYPIWRFDGLPAD